MRIVVIQHVSSGDYAGYIFSLIVEKAKQNNYQVKNWSNSVPAFQQQVANNAVVFITLENNTAFALNWLYKVKLPSVLKKIKAEVIIDLNGIALKKIKAPQLVVADQFLFLTDVKKLSGIQKFAFRNFQRTTQIANKVLIYSRENLNVTDKIEKEKLQTVFFTSPSIFKTFEWHEKIMIKAQQADNKEYFVAVVEDNKVNDFVLLLQAFSKFKKWQQSNMQLLVLPKYEVLGEAIELKYKTYKHRDDVHLIEEVEEKQIAAIIASAYAFLHVTATQPYLLDISIALQCSLPVISFKNDVVKEYAAEAVLFCDEVNAGAFGDALINLYKDEGLHARLKQEAVKQAEKLNRKAYEDKLWKLLETAAQA